MSNAALAGLANAAVGTTQQVVGNSVLSRMEHHQYREDQEYNYQKAQELQRNAAANQAEGLRKAGISLATMNGGNFQAAPSQSAPLQSKGVSQSKVDVMGDAIAAAQLENLESQRKLTDAQTVKTQSETKGLDNANDLFGEKKHWIDGFVKLKFPAIWNKFQNEFPGEAIGLGFLEAHREVLDQYKKEVLDGKDISEANRDRFLADMQTNSPAWYNSVVRLPAAQRDNLIADTAHLEQLNNLVQHQIPLTDAETLKLTADIQQINMNIQSMIINHPMLAAYLGDYKAMALGMLGKLGDTAQGATESLIGAKNRKTVTQMNNDAADERLNKTLEHKTSEGDKSRSARAKQKENIASEKFSKETVYKNGDKKKSGSAYLPEKNTYRTYFPNSD